LNNAFRDGIKIINLPQIILAMDIHLVIKAVTYAAEKHKYQRRKGFNQVPYINHPLKVANLLSEAGENDENLLLAAILHDIIEDTDATDEELRREFNNEICEIVLEVTDDKELPYAIRKELQVKNTPNLSISAKKIKIADKICNIRDIVNYPLDWSTERKLSYLEWAEQVVQACRGINEKLDKIFEDTLKEGLEKLQGEL
jgi:guanosine-3',5'-bis(diphosphate) 3'-pyrophosphohydrolase